MEVMAGASKANGAPPEDFFEEVDAIVAEQDRGLLAHAAVSRLNGAAAKPLSAEDWSPPISLDTPILPAFPKNTFPSVIADMVEATVAATETPPELAIGMALGVLAAACQRKTEVRVKPGYTEPINLFALAPLDSGNRKTAVQQWMTQPLVQWERDRAKEMKSEIARAISERETKLAQIQVMRAKAARLEHNSPDFTEHSSQIAALEEALPEVPHAPQIWCQDVTPERLSAVMALNGERMAILSDEGGLFSIMAGLYSRGVPNIDIFLQGHAGSAHRVERVNRPPVLMQRPALTIVMSPQPEVLHGLAKNRDFRGRGLLARYTYFLAASQLGYRNGEAPPVPESVANAYENCIRQLLNIVAPQDAPLTIELSEAARAEWREYSAAVEKDMRPDGRFEHMRDWGGKLPGMAARVAGLLHCAEHAFDADLTASKLSLDTMRRALDFAAVSAEHALAAYALMGADEALKDARKLWGWIDRRRKVAVTFRDAHQALRGSFPRSADLEPAFDVLVERSYLVMRESAGRVGRPTKIYRINPALTADWPKETG